MKYAKISELAMVLLIIVLFSCFLCKVPMQMYQVCASLILTIDDRVPLGFRQFREGPEFCSIL